jgi:hypothetical protein
MNVWVRQSKEEWKNCIIILPFPRYVLLFLVLSLVFLQILDLRTSVYHVQAAQLGDPALGALFRSPSKSSERPGVVVRDLHGL